ncbi:SAM-dependent methyltransferase [Nocardia sp. NBC_00511]|uniref:SAM-dependent methyltransferase n=1 Tax=Nocardia sp. NBC_00511 TaxID=2903591 RepID=UPI0030DEDE9B
MEPEKADVRPEWAPLTVDLDRPSVARVWDFYLGGSHNFQVDRELARQTIAQVPDALVIVRESRAFLRRAVRYLAERGIDQFLDIGSGIPTVGNVHEVARATRPDARVVYVDSDPVAVTHSRALLQHDSRTLVLEADLRDPEQVIDDAAELIDFSRPVAVLLIAVLHFLPDADDPAGIVARIAARLAPGSHLVIVHGSADTDAHHAAAELYNKAANPFHLRDRAEILTFFDGFELVAPGLVAPSRWQSDQPAGTVPALRTPGYAGVGRLP